MSFAPGSRLGPFEIDEHVDLPGFGEVYRARDVETQREFALHVLRTSDGHQDAIRDQFEQDVRAAAARVQSDPLTIHLVGVDPGAIYVVSEPIQPPSAAPIAPIAAPVPVASAVRRDLRAPRRHWVTGAALLLLVVATAVIATRDGEPEQGMADAGTASVPARPAAPDPPLPTATIDAPEPVAPEPEPEPGPEPTFEGSRAEPREPSEPVEPPERVERSAPAPPAAAPPEPLASREPPSPREPARSVVPPTDSRDASTLITEATVRATEFDLEGALSLLDVAAARGDAFAQMAAWYVRGVIGARAAFRDGGDPQALAPVQESLMALGEISRGRPGAAEIARMVLQAAAAAAQSERDEMRLYIEAAIQMETLQLAAGQRGAPMVSASEIAGDFWLQVHRYDEARRTYADAAERVGFSLRILSGLARTARRLNDMPAACDVYRRLVDVWGARPGLPVEIAEGRAYLGGCSR